MAEHHYNAPDSLKRGQRIPLSQRISNLVEQMTKSIASNSALNFSEAAHREITEALHILSYTDTISSSDNSKHKLKVVYGDGSKASDLKLEHLIPASKRFDNDRALHVGTLSFRHLDYDSRIDLYLVRDRETRRCSNADIDKLAYERAKELFQDSALRSQESYISIFQTGLEPLVVGVYRALIEELAERKSRGLPSLVVRPMFFADDEKDHGQMWS